MAFCRLVFPILVLSVLASASVQVPVYIWGDLEGKPNSASPLSLISNDEFKGILKRELKEEPFTVMFIDDTLSVEDLSHKNSEGETSFSYLHSNIGDAMYLPAVDNPLGGIYDLADPEKVDHVKLTENGLSAEIEPDSGKYLFIVLKDAREGESRFELLKRHDEFMEEMFAKLKEHYDNVVAIYTAEYPSWVIPDSHSRVRRQASNGTTRDYTMEGLKLSSERIIFNNGKNYVVLSGFRNSKSQVENSYMTTEMEFEDRSLTLNFTKAAGYWYFKTVTLQQTAPTEFTHTLLPYGDEVYAFLGFSYRCGQNVTFRTVNDSDTFTVIFQNLKVQPFFNNATNHTFGDSLNCVGFFSAPIWAALFVTFILLAITFYGIMMMMDIRTMDRFDDPKGKTITINAGE